MKNILVVVDEKNADSLIKKCLLLSPKSLFILTFSSTKEEVSANLTAKLKSLTSSVQSQNCSIETLVIPIDVNAQKAEKIIESALKYKVDTIAIHRRKNARPGRDFSYEKQLLRGLPKAELLMLGDNNWKDQVEVLGTLDVMGPSKTHKALNSTVYSATKLLVNRLSATFHLMSVIVISRVSEELDVVQKSEVLTKKGKQAEAKLAEYAKAKNIKLHLAAGSPSKEIPRLSSKIKADLVVLGNVGRTGVQGLILGNTAEKILSRLNTDVLIVK